MIGIDSELVYSNIRFHFTGVESSHDVLQETRVVREVVGNNEIKLSTVNGQINELVFQPKLGQTSSIIYDISNMEAYARVLVTDELGENLKGVSKGEVINASIGLVDEPNRESIFKRATIVPLSDLIEIGKHSGDAATVFVSEFSASDKRAYVENYLKHSQLQVAYDASCEETPVIRATLSPISGGFDAHLEITNIELRVIKGEEALIGIGGSVKDVSHHQQFTLTVGGDEYGKKLRINEFQHQDYERFVSYSMDIAGVDVGSFEMAYSSPDGFKFIDIKYRLGESGSILEIIDQDNTVIQMEFMGERGDSVRIIETKEDSTYTELDP